MNLLGKIFLVLLIPAAATGTALLTRYLQIKNSYTQPLVTLKDEVNKNAEDIARLEEQIRDSERQLQRVMQEFEVTWDNVTASPQVAAPDQLYLQLNNVGTSSGLGTEVTNDAGDAKVRKHSVIHVFIRKAPGSNETSYIGRFVLTSDATKILADKVDVLPDWTIEEGDWKMFGVADGPAFQQQVAPLYAQVEMTRKALESARVDLLKARDAAARMQAATQIATLEGQLTQQIQTARQTGWQRLLGRLGPVWRIHGTIPPPISTEFTDKYLALEKEKIDLDTVAVHKIHSDRDLQKTQAEVVALEKLIAGDNRDGQGGLIQELRQAETERNKVLVEVDQYRQLIFREEVKRKKLVDENVELVKKMPQPPGYDNPPPKPKTAPKKQPAAKP